MSVSSDRSRANKPRTDRAWPLPKQPWIMRMAWSELLFAHWAIEPEAVASLLPAGVTLDTHAFCYHDGKGDESDSGYAELERGGLCH
jgi:hypothetical protein